MPEAEQWDVKAARGTVREAGEGDLWVADMEAVSHNSLCLVHAKG